MFGQTSPLALALLTSLVYYKPLVRAQNSTAIVLCELTERRVGGAESWGIFGNVSRGVPLTNNTENAYQYLYTDNALTPDNFPADVSIISPRGVPAPNDTFEWSLCFIDIPLSLTSIYNAQNDTGTCGSVLNETCMLNITGAAFQLPPLGEPIATSDPAGRCSQLATNIANSVAPDSKGPCSNWFSPSVRTDIYSTLVNGNNQTECSFASTRFLNGSNVVHVENVNNTMLRDYVGSTTKSHYESAVHDVRAVVSFLLPNNQVDPYQHLIVRPEVQCVRVSNTDKSAPPVSPLASPPASAAPLLAPNFSVMAGLSMTAVLAALSFA